MKCPFTTNTSNKQCASFCSLILGYHLWCACVCVCVCGCCVYVCAFVNGLRVCEFMSIISLRCCACVSSSTIWFIIVREKFSCFFYIGLLRTPRNSGGGVTPFNPLPKSYAYMSRMFYDNWSMCLLTFHTHRSMYSSERLFSWYTNYCFFIIVTNFCSIMRHFLPIVSTINVFSRYCVYL